MTLTPEDIEAHTFKVARRGYDKVEVDRFLGQVATDYRQMHEAVEAAAEAPAAPAPLPRREPPAIKSRTPAREQSGGQLFALAGTPALPYAPEDDEPEVDTPLASTHLADTPVADTHLTDIGGPGTPAASVPPVDRTDEVLTVTLGSEEPAPSAPSGDDEFNRLGSEVASVLRTAHHSVATLRQEAEVEASLIRQRAEREIDELRRSADEYAARVRVEADAYAVERANEAHISRREADRVLAEAKAKAELTDHDASAALAEAKAKGDLAVADAESKAATALAEANALAQAALAQAEADAAATRAAAEAQAAALLTDAERQVAAITERAEEDARSRAHDILAEADQRLYDADRQLEQARQAEAALRDKLAVAHGDLAAVLDQFASGGAPAPTATPTATPTIDLTETDASDPAAVEPTIDLTDEPDPASPPPSANDAPVRSEPTVPEGWPGPAPTGATRPSAARPDDLFGDRGAVATAQPVVRAPVESTESAGSTDASEAIDPPATGDDPLTDIVRDAIGRAVQSAVQRDDEG